MVYIEQLKYAPQQENASTIEKFEENGVVLNLFGKGNKKVIKLGIQGIPGTQLRLNNIEDFNYRTDDNIEPSNLLSLGNTGIFEIDLEDFGGISYLGIPQDSANKYDTDSNSRILLIDFVYKL